MPVSGELCDGSRVQLFSDVHKFSKPVAQEAKHMCLIKGKSTEIDIVRESVMISL